MDGLEFEFFLASKLGMTRADLIAKISNAEFVAWTRFYARKQQAEEMARMGAPAA